MVEKAIPEKNDSDKIRAFNALRICIKRGLKPFFSKTMTEELYNEVEQQIMVNKPLYALLEHKISINENEWIWTD